MMKEKDLKEQKRSINSIQKSITQGKEVLIKKNDEHIKVNIRYNNKDKDGSLKWILMISGSEFFCNEIIINTPTITESVNIENVGIKHHICCLAVEIKFENNIALIK